MILTEKRDEWPELEKIPFFLFLTDCYKSLDSIANQLHWAILVHLLEVVFQFCVFSLRWLSSLDLFCLFSFSSNHQWTFTEFKQGGALSRRDSEVNTFHRHHTYCCVFLVCLTSVVSVLFQACFRLHKGLYLTWNLCSCLPSFFTSDVLIVSWIY